MLPNVKVLIQNGSLGGLVAFAEGVAGLIGTGVSVVTKIQVGAPIQVFSLADAMAQGITLLENPTMYKAVKEFYAFGDGPELNIMIVADTMEQTEMMDKTNANGAVKLLTFGQGRIRLLASTFLPPVGYVLVTTNGLDADVFSAITNAHALAQEWADNNSPVRVLLEGRNFTGVAANLTDLLTLTKNRVGVVLGDTVSGTGSAVGLALGCAASLPCMRKISRVKNGSLPILAAYAGTNLVDTYSSIGAIHDKGYIVIRKFPSLGGYFFGSDHMATANTDDYATLGRGRVIDKAAVLAYGTYVEELDDEIIIKADGTLDDGLVKYLEEKIDNQIRNSMTANKQISRGRSSINPAQNVLSTNKTSVVLKITPVGHNSEIDVLLGFENPAQ